MVKRSKKTSRKSRHRIIKRKTIRNVLPQITPIIGNHNNLIMEILQKLAEYYSDIGDYFRMRSYETAVSVIDEYAMPIISGQQAQKLKGIGKSIAAKIDEILQTGKLDLLEKIEQTEMGKLMIIRYFRKIHGIGNKTAEKWYDKGYRTIKDVLSHEQLTAAQQIGLKYIDDFTKRIQREEITMVGKRITNVLKQLDPNLKMEICGSYRRELPSSGDIDCLITHMTEPIKDHHYLADIVTALHKANILTDDLSQGELKYMGVWRLPISQHFHRIDIRMIDRKEWPFATLYFTGSMKLNIQMRLHAEKLGLMLNENGIYKIVGKQKMESVGYYVESEEDIFKLLGLRYQAPKSRIFRVIPL